MKGNLAFFLLRHDYVQAEEPAPEMLPDCDLCGKEKELHPYVNAVICPALCGVDRLIDEDIDAIMGEVYHHYALMQAGDCPEARRKILERVYYDVFRLAKRLIDAKDEYDDEG